MQSPSLNPQKTHAKSHHISLQMAARDSPFLRANLNHFEDELEELLKWVDGLIKAGKGYADSFLKMNDFSLTLVASFTSHRRLSILGDTSVLDSFADALKTVCSLNAQMAEDLTENLVFPLQHYLREEIKELREHRKNHDRVIANYDAALVRYSQLPKNKEASALHEDSFVLFEAKKAYIHSNLNYADHVISFKNKMIYFFVQQLMLAMYTHMDYFENNFEVFHGMKSSMDSLKTRIEERKRALPTQDEILAYKSALEEEALSQARPKLQGESGPDLHPPVTILPNSTPPSRIVAGASIAGAAPPQLFIQKVALPGASMSNLTALPPSVIPVYSTEIEGYLFKKNEKKVWVRRYFLIKKGALFYASTYPTSKTQRGAVYSTNAWSVVSYSIRVDRVEDRRFCFEVFGSSRAIKLQAESEREMNEWINVFEAAKLAAIKNGNISLGADTTNILAQSSIGGAGAGAGLGSRPPSVRAPTPDDEGVAASDEADEAVSKLNLNADLDDDGAVSEADENVEEEVVEDSGTVNPVPFVDCAVVYPDKSLEARNKELHKLLKSVPPQDFLIDSFAIFLQRANLIQGKIYVTQNRICFHSNIMGIISILVISLKEITSITRTRHGLYKCINIETTKAPHQFKTFMKDDAKTHFVIAETWKNATRSTGRLNAQELFDTLTATESKMDEKDESKALKGHDTDDGASITAELVEGDGVKTSTEFDLPEGMSPPGSNPSCECSKEDHHEAKDQEFSINIPAKRAFELIFSNDRPETKQLWSKLFSSRGETNVVSEPWVEPATGTILGDAPAGAIASKVLNYTMPMNNPMVKLKEVGVDSILYLIKRVDYFVYVVEKRGCTLAAPYGDNFTTITRYCIMWTGKTSCKVLMNSGVKFFKSPMVKGIIKQQALAGSAAFSADFSKFIKSEVNALLARENATKPGGSSVLAEGGRAVDPAVSSDNAAESSLSSDTESILPFGLSHSYLGQWGLVGILSLSLLLNLLSLFRSSPMVTKDAVVTYIRTSNCLVAQHDSVDWRNEISSTSRLGSFSEKSIYGYLQTHFPGWTSSNCNMSVISPWRASIHRIAHQPPPVYHHDKSRAVHQQLLTIHRLAFEAREDAFDSLKWLDELERDVFWAGYWNFVSDRLDTENEWGLPLNE